MEVNRSSDNCTVPGASICFHCLQSLCRWTSGDKATWRREVGSRVGWAGPPRWGHRLLHLHAPLLHGRWLWTFIHTHTHIHFPNEHFIGREVILVPFQQTFREGFPRSWPTANHTVSSRDLGAYLQARVQVRNRGPLESRVSGKEIEAPQKGKPCSEASLGPESGGAFIIMIDSAAREQALE